MTPVTPERAASLLNEWAEIAEDENYHSEAGVLWTLAEEVGRITERTLIVAPGADEEIHRLLVVPEPDEDAVLAANSLYAAAAMADRADEIGDVYYDLAPIKSGDRLRRVADRIAGSRA